MPASCLGVVVVCGMSCGYQMACGCEVCWEVNNFLLDPTCASMEIDRASANSSRRRHLKDMIDQLPGHQAAELRLKVWQEDVRRVRPFLDWPTASSSNSQVQDG